MKVFALTLAIVLSFFLMPPGIAPAQQATDAKIAQAEGASPKTTDVRPPTIDPASLPGEWMGLLRSTVGTGNATVYVTVKRIRDDVIEGVFYMQIAGSAPSFRYVNRDVPFSSKLEGNQFRFNEAGMNAVLTVMGPREMEAQLQGHLSSVQVELVKLK